MTLASRVGLEAMGRRSSARTNRGAKARTGDTCETIHEFYVERKSVVMTKEQQQQLERLATAIRASPHNLMSPRAMDELERRHLPECLALADLLPTGCDSLVDVGAGGGLPGLVIAVARPDLNVTLVESTEKKARFLAATAREMGCDVRVVNERIEVVAGPGGRLRDAFDLATARAVAPLPTLVEWVVPALRPGGRLFAVKGERWRAEVAAAGATLEELGARVVSTPNEGGGDEQDTLDPPLRVVMIAA